MKTQKRTLFIVIAIVGLLVSVGSAAEDQSWQDLDKQAKRTKVDETAKQALDQVLAESDKAKALYENSYGWAAFDNLKIAFGWSGGGGNGVAVNGESGTRTYMKMGTVGVGFGVGGQKYQVVFFFQDEQTFRSFVDKGWKADTSAQAAAGTEGVGAQSGFVNGIAAYQLTNKGLMASVDISGTKYWKNKKLN